VNLGQGFPNFGAPQALLEAASNAILDRAQPLLNQYTRPSGHPRLANALCSYFGPSFCGPSSSAPSPLLPERNLLVTVGASEGIFLVMQALLDPEDEVLLIEPFYDTYPTCTRLAGGRTRFVRLRPPKDGTTQRSHSAGDWYLDMQELEDAVTTKTKLLVINNPQNVPGKVYNRGELQALADFAERHDLLVLSDEVYEWLTYDSVDQVRFASLPGMFDRTVTLGSAGKGFSVTGWKVGWAFGPEPLIAAMLHIHQNLPFCHGTPLQEALAVLVEGMLGDDSYLCDFKAQFSQKRSYLCEVLERSGLPVVRPQGSYFALADFSGVSERHYLRADPREDPVDYQFCRWLTTEIGVTAIPPSAFYDQPTSLARDHRYARFCFAKDDSTLSDAELRLRSLVKYMD